MGFFKDLLKGFLRGGVTINLGGGGRRPSRPAYNHRDPVERVDYDELSKKTIDEVVRSLFTEGYTIKTDVSTTEFGPYESTYKYSHVVYDASGAVKVAVYGVCHNGERNRNFYNLKKTCEERGIPFVYFYTQMTNERSYVEERIKAAL